MLNGRQKWICDLLFAVKGSYCERFEDDEDDPMLFGEGCTQQNVKHPETL